MQERIEQQLQEIENQRHVSILYAVESGSRAWGFASPNSDYDVRFIYIRPVRDYLRIQPLRDVIELPIVDDLDVNGWDIVKALNLFRSSNPPLLEWLHSPIVYRETGGLAADLREIARTNASLRRMTYHYLSMARTQFKSYIEDKAEVPLKKYLYVLRPLVSIRWLEQHHMPSPTSIWDTLAGISLEATIANRITDLLNRKRSAQELGTGEPEPLLNAFFQEEIARITESVVQLPDPNMEADLLNALFWKYLNLPEVAA
jgi:predicted nucleotidyltransferase